MKLDVIVGNPSLPVSDISIVLIHGACHSNICWHNFLDALGEANFRTIAISLRGHGHSEGREKLRYHRITDYVEDIVRVIQPLSEKPVLIGHSMGAYVAQKYLENYKAHGAILMAPASPLGIRKTTLRIIQKYPGIFAKINLTASIYPWIGTPERARRAFFSENLPDAKLYTYFEQLQDESYLAYLDMLCLNPTHIHAIQQTPLLVLGAENDKVFHVDEIHSLAQGLGITPRIFKDMAHDMMLEEGWEDVVNYIIQWLTIEGTPQYLK